jgi:hypothetical protein
MPEVILHHYSLSSFSEKVRLALGLKGLARRSVDIATAPPRSLHRQRVTALGHGRPEPMSAEEAFAVARDAKPAICTSIFRGWASTCCRPER